MTQSATLDVTLTVSGMKCGGCENNVKVKLNAIDGIITVDAIQKEDIVRVEFDDTKTSLNEIKQTIAECGYTVEE